MKGLNTQISAYSKDRPPKFHEIELLKLIKKNQIDDYTKVLDIGCASGSFLSLISKEFPKLSYSGFDISEKLISDARDNLSTIDVNLRVSDALSFTPEHKYDLIIASGVLSIFEDLSPLKLWSSWLAERGNLYIFGRFNTKDIDTIIRFRNHYQGKVENTPWEGGLTAFSLKYVKEYLASIGLKSKFIRFNFPEKLSISDNPIRTYTVDTIDDQKLIINGANTIAEHYFLVISH